MRVRESRLVVVGLALVPGGIHSRAIGGNTNLQLGSRAYRQSKLGRGGDGRRIVAANASVQGRKTYFYAIKAVNVSGSESGPSNVIRVVVPSP